MNNGDTFYFIELDGRAGTALYNEEDIFTVAMYFMGNFFATQADAEKNVKNVLDRYSCVGAVDRTTRYYYFDCFGNIHEGVYTKTMFEAGLRNMGNLFFSPRWALEGYKTIKPFLLYFKDRRLEEESNNEQE